MTKPHLDNVTGTPIIPLIFSGAPQDQEKSDLNEILRSVVEKYKGDAHKNFILRFDDLPMVIGAKENFICLFDALICMVISHPPVHSKLFLYIKCIEEKQEEEIIDLSATEEKIYRINFFSNITTDGYWEEANKTRLSECALQATKNGGNFSFFPISNTGCLFSVILPGKIN